MTIGNKPDKMEEAADAEDLMQKISELTDKVAGCNKGIIDEPIYVEIESPSSPDLTVIDLPGIARNPIVDSDQPDYIQESPRT